jgi:hypothetical protein
LHYRLVITRVCSLSERVPIPPSVSVEICFGSGALKARSPNRIDRVDRRESFSEKSTAVSARPPTSRLCNMIASSTVQENWTPCDRPRWPPRCRRQRVAVHQARRKRSRPIWPRGEFRLSYPAGGPRRSIQRNDFIFITLHARIT